MLWQANCTNCNCDDVEGTLREEYQCFICDAKYCCICKSIITDDMDKWTVQNPDFNLQDYCICYCEPAMRLIEWERRMQDKKWGEQNHDPFTWIAILQEEIGEYCQEALHLRFGGHKGAKLKLECIQVAAVAKAMVECLERGNWKFPK